MKSTLKAAMLGSALALSPLAGITALTDIASAQVMLQSFAPLVEKAKPAVVTVRVAANGGVRPADMPRGFERSPEMEEFFERFFGQPMPDMPEGPERGPRRAQGVGSGFIIDASGVIVTNNHVIDGADEITVILDDGTELDATLVGRDDKVDIAVLRVDAGRDLPTLDWGDSDTVRVGDWALAIGNPLGLDGTVTAGIVSSLGRDIRSGPYDDYIQVDAAINRGNSGGPLFDLEGNVIGVNTAILSPTGGNVGLGFAIPAAQAQEVVAELLEDGVVERGWIGVSIQPISPDIAESLALDGTAGALVAEVIENSPAQAAGLEAGDVILTFAGTPIEDLRDLTTSVARAEVGEKAMMTLWRNGKEVEVTIEPALMETASLAEPPVSPDSGTYIPELGLALAQDGDGVVIGEVAEGAAAASSGLREGDRILSINQTRITEPQAARTVIDEAKADDRATVLVLIDREGSRRFITLDLAEA